MTAPTTTAPLDIALEHYRRRQQLADAAAQLADQMWSEVDPDDIARSWAARIPAMTAVLTGAQLGAARAADGYAGDILDAQDLDVSPVSTVDPDAFAGRAADGRPLQTLLANPVVVTLAAIADGADVFRALTAGRANLEMLTRTQVADAGRLADQVALTTYPAATGYVRMTVGGTCSRCMVLAGRVYTWSRGFQRHPRCDCIHVPTAQARAAGLVQDPRSIYDRMTDAERLAAGFTKADIRAIADGADLEQIVNARHRPGALRTASGFRPGPGGRPVFTLEGSTRRGIGGVRLRAGRGQRAQRLTVDEIYARARGNRDEALELLFSNGYLLQRPITRSTLDLAAAAPSGAAAAGRRAGAAAAASTVQLRPGLARARSIRAVEAEFTQEYRRITGQLPRQVEFAGSIETAKEHAEGILRGLERFPEANMNVVTTLPGDPGRYALSVGNRIEFSEEWARDRRGYLRNLAADVESGFHPAGTGSPLAVAIHEFGHNVDLGTLAHAIKDQVNEAVARIARDLKIAPERVIEIGVSRYATRNTHELVAEAFVDTMVNGSRASRLSREIFDLLEAEYIRRGKRVGISIASATGPEPNRVTAEQLRALIGRRPTRRRRLGGGFTALTDEVWYGDVRAVRKIYGRRYPMTAEEIKHALDAEELGSLVVEAVGLRAPRVAQANDRVLLEFLEGTTGEEVLAARGLVDPPDDILLSDDGRRLGLADVLMAHGDRNEGNWMVFADGRLGGLDHGFAFHDEQWPWVESQFAGWMYEFAPVTGLPTPRDGLDLGFADVAGIRVRLQALRPRFEELGRLDWHDRMMRRLDVIESVAA